VAGSATIALAPRTVQTVDLTFGERCVGLIFLGSAGGRLGRHDIARIVRRIASRPTSPRTFGPYTLLHAFIPAALDAGVPPPCAMTGPAPRWIAPQHTELLPTSPEPSGKTRAGRLLISMAGCWQASAPFGVAMAAVIHPKQG
jgi:hypothetical protein